MGLFDDILKKPIQPAGQGSEGGNPTAGSGGSGTQASGQGAGGSQVIVKSETSTVFGPESETKAIEMQNAGPAAATAHAEEDASSVLVSSPQASAPIAPVAPVTEPIVVAPISEPQAPANIAPTTDTVASEIPLSPSIMPQPPIQDTVAPVQQNQDALQIPAGPSLFDHLMNDDAPAPQAPVVNPPVVNSPAFQFDAPAANTGMPAPQAAKTNPEPSGTQMSAGSYATPREFIEHSLDNIEIMLETIDTRHGAKMTEAEGYRMEKMRFAELEKNAYAEAEVMDRERDHTLRMKAIFERELEADQNNRTKKVTPHSEEHTEKHTSSHAHAHSQPHRRHVHDEEDALAAS